MSSQLNLDVGWRSVVSLRHECFALQDCTSDNRSRRRLVGSQIWSGCFLERAVSCLCLILYCSCSMQQAGNTQMFANLLQNIYIYYTLFLHVSAIQFCHLQRANASSRYRTKIIRSSSVSSRQYTD